MLYIITLIFFLIWLIYIIRKGHISWHALVSIYVVTFFIVDIGDVSFDYWVNFYDLPVHLLNNPDADHYLGIVLSDGIIFPLIAIIFCYYSVRYHHPWLLSILFASILGIIEFGFVKLGYMVYHHWNHWITPAITFVVLRILAHFAERFIYYSPPVSYRFRLICFTYAFTEWPGAIMGNGLMNLYQWRPFIFDNPSADDRFVAMILATVMGGLAATFAPKILQKYKIYLFLGLGLLSTSFVLWMHSKGLMLYNHWNDFFSLIRYMAPYLLIYFYDRWESIYSRQ